MSRAGRPKYLLRAIAPQVRQRYFLALLNHQRTKSGVETGTTVMSQPHALHVLSVCAPIPPWTLSHNRMRLRQNKESLVRRRTVHSRRSAAQPV